LDPGSRTASFQDYQFPDAIPATFGDVPVQNNPMLYPINVPAIFRANTHYLWKIKEYAISSAVRNLDTAISNCNVLALSNEPMVAYLQIRDLLLTFSNVVHLFPYWFGIATITHHPETIPYSDPMHTLLNFSNYCQFLETLSNDIPLIPHNFMCPDEPLYDIRVTPRQLWHVEQFTSTVGNQVIQLLTRCSVASGIYSIANEGGLVNIIN
jgi:hypothetical protein